MGEQELHQGCLKIFLSTSLSTSTVVIFCTCLVYFRIRLGVVVDAKSIETTLIITQTFKTELLEV